MITMRPLLLSREWLKAYLHIYNTRSATSIEFCSISETTLRDPLNPFRRSRLTRLQSLKCRFSANAECPKVELEVSIISSTAHRIEVAIFLLVTELQHLGATAAVRRFKIF